MALVLNKVELGFKLIQHAGHSAAVNSSYGTEWQKIHNDIAQRR